MPERILKVIEMLDLVEVRRLQNYRIMAAAIDALRAIAGEMQQQAQQKEQSHEI